MSLEENVMKLWPCWIVCPSCEDALCVRHGLHVFDCECPALEDWMAEDVDPWLANFIQEQS